MATDLISAAEQALEALEELNGWQSLAPPSASQAGRKAAINLRAALQQSNRAQRMRDAGFTRGPTIREMSEQKPNWRLSCGCLSQYGGIPAEWPSKDREGNPAVEYGVVCERHWHEYGAK
jgi:hypothetical protein